MNDSTLRSRLEAYVKNKYMIEPEQLPFNKENYAILRHPDSGKWFAVFIVKPRSEFGLEGDGNTEIVSLKIHDTTLADFLMQQPGYLRGFPSKRWNWVSIVLDGSVPLKDVCMWLDDSYTATLTKTKNRKAAHPKRESPQ